MALHRKLRGVVGGSPQYVRIPASRTSNIAVKYALQETHVHAQRLYHKRCAAGDRNDRSQKISSLQLCTCFLLCLLLYFGAIYFADDIASIGRVVGSEQNSQSFFVHSLRPHSRGNMRVGRAIEAKKVEATKAVAIAKEREDKQQHQTTQHSKSDVRPKELSEVEKHLHEAKVATVETEKAQATEPLEQPEREREVLRQDGENAREDGLANAADPDGQDVSILAQMKDTVIVDPKEEIPVARKPKVKLTNLAERNDAYDDSQNALRHRDKVRDVDTGPLGDSLGIKKIADSRQRKRQIKTYTESDLGTQRGVQAGSWTAPQVLESTKTSQPAHPDEGERDETLLNI
ncbi:unnamed protein product [Peronospora destructor]|uniref:Transmembrane protein n=1 Tax=Peronospora destructor TaxID=86335 RepID=A0AAV0TL06_9STRA|nr:unnamed protein product [Peronospora destructor]